MPSSQSNRLSQDKRIKKRREFLFVQRQGSRAFGRFVVAIGIGASRTDAGKFGITVPKKVGPAHIRNKIKRRIRHILRTNPRLFLAKNLVVVAKQTINNADFKALTKDLTQACDKVKMRIYEQN